MFPLNHNMYICGKVNLAAVVRFGLHSTRPPMIDVCLRQIKKNSSVIMTESTLEVKVFKLESEGNSTLDSKKNG